MGTLIPVLVSSDDEMNDEQRNRLVDITPRADRATSGGRRLDLLLDAARGVARGDYGRTTRNQYRESGHRTARGLRSGKSRVRSQDRCGTHDKAAIVEALQGELRRQTIWFEQKGGGRIQPSAEQLTEMVESTLRYFRDQALLIA